MSQSVLGEVSELRVEFARQMCRSEHEIGLIAAITHHCAPPLRIDTQFMNKIVELAVFIAGIIGR